MINKDGRKLHHKLWKQIRRTWLGKRNLRANFLNRFRVKKRTHLPITPLLFWWEANALNTPKKENECHQ